MKICQTCGNEIGTRDGDNECPTCELASRTKRATARQKRRERDQALRDMGMIKVRGALGGTYWE